MPNQFGPFGDPQFWQDIRQNASQLNPYARLQEFGRIPKQADDIAEREFPNSARDSSTKNAFRHALGTGMLTQGLGGGPMAGGLAKAAGYGWEGILGANKLIENKPGYRTDVLHDLNANAIGSNVAQQTANQQELINALRGFAKSSVLRQPPGVFERSPGYMTRTVR